MRIINPLRWKGLFEQWWESHTAASPSHDFKSLEITISQISEWSSLANQDAAEKHGSLKEVANESSPSLPPVVSQPNKPQPTSPQPRTQHSNASSFCDNGIPLPGSSKKIFLSIQASSPTWSNDEYQERFRFVKGELIRAVVDHPKLRSSGRYVTYSLHMIGTARDTATPHIVIGCRRCDLEALQDLFYNNAAQRLYCFKDSSWEKLFRSHTEPPMPPFKLFFLHTSQAPVRRYASFSSLSPVYKTLCGALIGYGGRTATVGLVLNICGVLRLLTVGHLFDDHAENSDPFYWIGSYLSRYAPENSLLLSNQGLKPDDVYGGSDMLGLDDHSSNAVEGSTTTSDKAWDEEIERMRTLAQRDMIQGNVIKPTDSLSARAPDLDWAISELGQPIPQGPLLNMISPEASASPVVIKEIELSPRYHGVPVYMVSGINGVRKGHLFEGETYLGPEEGREPCGVWTMILDSSQGLVPGECGSIVVDQKTFAVYGHVIGSNVLENIYVVPFCQTVQQIQESFNTTAEIQRKVRNAIRNRKSAGERGNDAAAEILLATNGIDVNAADPFLQRSPLHRVVGTGRYGIVKMLLADKRVDVNCTTALDETPLFYAAESGHDAIVELLLQTEKVNLFYLSKGNHPLTIASWAGHTAVVKLLVGVSAGKFDVNFKDKKGYTPLHTAARHGHTEVVAVLLDKGADPKLLDDEGCTALVLAKKHGKEGVVDLLLGHGVDSNSSLHHPSQLPPTTATAISTISTISTHHLQHKSLRIVTSSATPQRTYQKENISKNKAALVNITSALKDLTTLGVKSVRMAPAKRNLRNKRKAPHDEEPDATDATNVKEDVKEDVKDSIEENAEEDVEQDVETMGDYHPSQTQNITGTATLRIPRRVRVRIYHHIIMSEHASQGSHGHEPISCDVQTDGSVPYFRNPIAQVPLLGQEYLVQVCKKIRFVFFSSHSLRQFSESLRSQFGIGQPSQVPRIQLKACFFHQEGFPPASGVALDEWKVVGDLSRGTWE
ncbi:rna binding protein [Fusarium austroafricanum]|uniref:Rna binding protein n=1 Tax=Fusarium austroafricanum TaxID=2364996 RepID=A0A8H4NLM3_9HYPO|nr:rna binding protein [Fusarium austroafricanum]